MKTVIFVCLGNICRSPMAEMMFKDLVKQANLEDQFEISSMATSTYEIGNPPHPGAIAELNKREVPVIEHFGAQISDEDFKRADVVIGMDEQNIIDLKNMAPAGCSDKVKMAYDVLGVHKVIQDPWYDHKFDRTYSELAEVLPAWLKELTK
ncbi:low molecular weight protein-tyrosine-phosphatase [Companilactobacillus zhongbaensis]|uniref:low molecular weight protein-tyrosine-phosphatase n=1 Tax=Companilactobacillus zhongbaensis TaxID=2486009 RepID=UPI000F7A7DE6|nr:low molecular weight protein-tyrosine-phosphatase [Companilactobacillus zhongbaensis]